MAGRGKTGGRQKGTPNKRSGKPLYDKFKNKHGVDPIELLFLVAIDQMPCTRCDDDGLVDPLVAHLMTKSSNSKARTEAALKSEKGEFITCPACGGSKHKFLEDGAQSRAIIRLVDSDLPKLASVVHEDLSGVVMLSRMNSVSRLRQEQLERMARDEEEAAKNKANQ